MRRTAQRHPGRGTRATAERNAEVMHGEEIMNSANGRALAGADTERAPRRCAQRPFVHRFRVRAPVFVLGAGLLLTALGGCGGSEEPSPTSAQSSESVTLIGAIKSMQTSEVEAALQHDRNFEELDEFGWAPIHYAINLSRNPDNEALEVVRLLMDSGADIRLQTRDGDTVLHLATRARSEEMSRFLVEMGLEVNAQDAMGTTPLAFAAKFGKSDICRLLVEAGADPNLARLDGWTPLHFAARFSRLETAELLLELGADVDGGSPDTGTPLHLAAFQGHDAMVELLLAAGANPNAVAITGETPLHLAAARGNSQIVALLLAAGGDGDVRTREGRTPAELAEANGQEESARQLREAAIPATR